MLWHPIALTRRIATLTNATEALAGQRNSDNGREISDRWLSRQVKDLARPSAAQNLLGPELPASGFGASRRPTTPAKGRIIVLYELSGRRAGERLHDRLFSRIGALKRRVRRPRNCGGGSIGAKTRPEKRRPGEGAHRPGPRPTDIRKSTSRRRPAVHKSTTGP